jgi:hypothetical protein
LSRLNGDSVCDGDPPKNGHREKLDHSSRQEGQATHDKTETASYFK